MAYTDILTILGSSNFIHPLLTCFSIKIGSTTFSSGRTPVGTSITPLTAFNLIEDIGTPVTSGTQLEMTKKFTGSYSVGGNSYSFPVTLKITYNTSSPDYFIKHATIDVTNIPGGTPIFFAYGWDTYVNNNDVEFAYIVPDVNNYNDYSNGGKLYWYMTTADVQSLRLVGAKNTSGNGALIGFFPIGRIFDRAYSAAPYTYDHCYNLVNMNTSGATGLTATTPAIANNPNYPIVNTFKFGPYANLVASYDDNGAGVGYDSIPPGQITELKTGITFAATLDGELDYTWNYLKNLTANIGDSVNLNLSYRSYNILILNNVGYRVDFPGLQINSSCSSSGFSGGTSDCTFGNEYYQRTGSSVAANGTAADTIPVIITRAGQWIIDGHSITDMTQTLPLGSPATLTVNTTVSLANKRNVDKQQSVGCLCGR